MVYKGHVCGDVIVLSEGIRLPDGVEVLVEPIAVPAPAAPTTDVKLRNGIALFESTVASPPPSLGLVNELRDDAL